MASSHLFIVSLPSYSNHSWCSIVLSLLLSSPFPSSSSLRVHSDHCGSPLLFMHTIPSSFLLFSHVIRVLRSCLVILAALQSVWYIWGAAIQYCIRSGKATASSSPTVHRRQFQQRRRYKLPFEIGIIRSCSTTWLYWWGWRWWRLL